MNLGTCFSAKIPLGALPWLQPESCSLWWGSLFCPAPTTASVHITGSLTTPLPCFLFPQMQHVLTTGLSQSVPYAWNAFPLIIPKPSTKPSILCCFLSLTPHIQSTKKPGGFQYTSFGIHPQSVQDSRSLLSSLSLILAPASNVAPCFGLCAPAHPWVLSIQQPE